MGKRKYGWAVFYDQYDKNKSRVSGTHLCIVESPTPICRNGMKFAHYLRRNTEPQEDQRCVACVRLTLMQELAE